MKKEEDFLFNILEKDTYNLFSFYIVTGDKEKNKKDIFSFLEKKIDFEKENNTDYFYFKENSLSIDTTREIKKINSLKKNSEEIFRIFLIESNFLEEFSQNALLKTLEEPKKNTIFFLLLPDTEFILDTIKSRARIISGYNLEKKNNFFEKSFLERKKEIDKISKSSKETSEVRENFLNLIFSLENEILENKKNIENFSEVYKNFLELKNQARLRGSNLKNILIYLSIVLPVKE